MRYVLAGVLFLTALARADSSVPPLKGPIDLNVDVWLFEPGRVVIDGWGLPPRESITIRLDEDLPHASLACRSARQRKVVSDQTGHFRFVLAPAGECALGDEPFILMAETRHKVLGHGRYLTRPPKGGSWQLSGVPFSDSCGGTIVLAARNLRIEADGAILRADVVNRTYPARIDDGVIQARGSFNEHGNHIDETWTLEKTGPDNLLGTLVSSWRFADGTKPPCRVTFGLSARWTAAP